MNLLDPRPHPKEEGGKKGPEKRQLPGSANGVEWEAFDESGGLHGVPDICTLKEKVSGDVTFPCDLLHLAAGPWDTKLEVKSLNTVGFLLPSAPSPFVLLVMLSWTLLDTVQAALQP